MNAGHGGGYGWALPLVMTRMLANNATRYGTLSLLKTSKNGDTSNTDAMATKDGAYGDISWTHAAGELLASVCWSADAIYWVTRVGTCVACLGVMSGDTGYVT